MAQTSWLTRPLSPTRGVRLFCFPYAGGGASIFRGWQQNLPASIEVCPVQLPGRENRLQEKPLNRLGPLVQALAEALLPYLRTPFAFFGHSMGALVSYELARQLREAGGPVPSYLFVSASPAPPFLNRSAPLHPLPEAEFIAVLRHRHPEIPAPVFERPELREIYLPLIRADLAVIETYHYKGDAPLDCPILAFGGEEDPVATRPDLEAWQFHTTGDFGVEMHPGGHFFLKESQAKILASIQRSLLALVKES